MVVDAFVQAEAGIAELVQLVGVLDVVAYLIIDYARGVDEPCEGEIASLSDCVAVARYVIESEQYV